MNNAYIKLPGRGVIYVEGSDRHDFLQNLVTNDLKAIGPDKLVYACLLTAQGKFLHDFFMSEDRNLIRLECEGAARAQDLYDRLSLYKLRADVQISIEKDGPVYAVFDQAVELSDPRHAAMGRRVLKPPAGLDEHDFAVWDKHRISLGIPDGSRDMVPGKSTLLACRIDRLSGVSFEKGCYIGQELTARMHYRGLAKKHLYVIAPQTSASTLPPSFTEIKTDSGVYIGEMRSSCENLGLALLKDKNVQDLTGYKTINPFL